MGFVGSAANRLFATEPDYLLLNGVDINLDGHVVRNFSRVLPVALSDAVIQPLDSYFTGQVKADLPVNCLYVEIERKA